jgi:hypothetical protein
MLSVACCMSLCCPRAQAVHTWHGTATVFSKTAPRKAHSTTRPPAAEPIVPHVKSEPKAHQPPAELPPPDQKDKDKSPLDWCVCVRVRVRVRACACLCPRVRA